VAAAFSHRRAFLVTLAHREEGLILPPGNPRRVKDFGDVVRQRLRFANREAGTGVRVLGRVDRDVAPIVRFSCGGWWTPLGAMTGWASSVKDRGKSGLK
jgi:hypothetical protein